MKKIFIDTSVLFSACSSKSGASARILQLCKQRKVQGYISQYVIIEIKRNVTEKLGQIEKQRLNSYMLQTHLSIVDNPTKEEILECEEIINKKDAPILACVLNDNIDVLITLNTRDFMKQKVKEFTALLKILTPRDFILLYEKRKQQEGH